MNDVSTETDSTSSLRGPECSDCDISSVDPESLFAVLSCLSDVYIFVKDRNSLFRRANARQLAKVGLSREEQIIGKSDFDYFSGHMIAQYHNDDRHVMRTGKPIRRKVESVANPDGSVSWHVTSKFPLYDKSQQCIGLVGIMRDLDRDASEWKPFRRINAAIDYVATHYSEPIEIAVLAKHCGLSISQFDRRFQIAFGQTPAKYVIRYRLIRASQLLVTSDRTISAIAHEVGFYDHSHFSREFRKMFGMAPGKYRREHEQ